MNVVFFGCHSSCCDTVAHVLSVCLSLAAFEITIDHPHTHVVKCTQLVRGECGSPPHIPSLLCEEHLSRLSMFLLLSMSLQPVRTWLRRPTLWPPTGSATEQHRRCNMLFALARHLLISSLSVSLSFFLLSAFT